MIYAISLAVVAVFFFLIIALNERYGLLSADHFPSLTSKLGAYAWLGVLLLLVSLLVTGASQREPDMAQIESVSFWGLFDFHLILLVFLLGWWLLTARPPLARFMNLRKEDLAQTTLIGIAVGVGGWALTILLALGVAMILNAFGLVPEDLKPSPMIPWMAALPAWKKGVIILSAMTIEEAFFRGFLQKRVGLVLSTIVFALAHAGYGQPFMLIGIVIISLIIGITFWRTKNLWPCIVAHGVFDAVQLFVIVPLALKYMPA